VRLTLQYNEGYVVCLHSNAVVRRERTNDVSPATSPVFLFTMSRTTLRREDAVGAVTQLVSVGVGGGHGHGASADDETTERLWLHEKSGRINLTSWPRLLKQKSR
jgi:hypothetical protein